MKGKISILLIVILTIAVGTKAEDSSPREKDFAYGFQLDADGKMPLYKVLLPEEVYSITTRKDMGDIRIFNNQGETVPYVLKKPTPVKTESVQTVSLPFFPLYGSMQSTDKQTLKVETDFKGTIITLSDDRIEQSPTIKGYIIDTSMLQSPAESLQLEWENKGDSFVTSVAVSYSGDLINWHSLNQNITLARLKYNKHELVASVIPLPLKKHKYLKLNWPVESGRGALTSVMASIPPKKIKPQKYKKELDGNLKDKDPIAYEYDTGSNIPIEELNILFPYKNILVKTVAYSRSQKENQWIERFQGLAYSMEVDGLTLSNSPFKIPMTTDRYWLLKITSIEGKLLDIPRLRLGWVPHEIIFIAQGKGPFLLAYGSAHVKPHSQSANSFFATINEKNTDSYVSLDERHSIVFGKEGVGKTTNLSAGKDSKKVPILTTEIIKKVQLGGNAQLKAIKKRPWKRWIIWATMLVGLGILGRMVWILNMEMQNAGKNSTS